MSGWAQGAKKDGSGDPAPNAGALTLAFLVPRSLWTRIGVWLAASLVGTSFWPLAVAQSNHGTALEGGAIRGSVSDSAQRPVLGATVLLHPEGKAGGSETRTDAEGGFSFSALGPGSYAVDAEKDGVRGPAATVTLTGADESIRVQLTLNLERSPATPNADRNSRPDPSAAMEFADQPNFTVAGVTDWTAAGGHGSDAILRTSETLARDTLKLKPGGADVGAGATLDGLRAEKARLLAQGDSADALRKAGEVDEKLGDPLAAVREFERAARLDPSEGNYFAWGSELLLHRAVWQAKEVFEKGSAAYPRSVRLLSGLGSALFAGARYGEASDRLCAASDLDPADPEPYLFLGKIAIAAPEPLPCVEERLARFVREQPDNSIASYLYAMAIWKRIPQPPDTEGELALRRVEELLTRAVTLDPKCADGYLQLGVLSASRRNYPGAIEAYRKAIEANPQLGDAHYRLGVAYDRTGDAAKAEREFQLHDELERQRQAEIEEQRKEIKQFLIVLDKPAASSASQQ